MILSEDWPRITGPKVINGLSRWVVDARPRGRKFFPTENEARNYRELLRREVALNGINGRGPSQEMDAARAREILSPFNVSLSSVAADWVKRENERRAEMSVKISSASSAWLEAKEKEFEKGRIAKATIEEIRLMQKIFASAWPNATLGALSSKIIQQWLDGISASPRRRHNLRVKLVQLLNHCVKSGWMRENPAEATEVRLPPPDEASILTVPECQKLIEAARSCAGGAALPYVLIGLFCGLRPGELDALQWSEIEKHQIRVLAATSKTKQTRYIPVQNALSCALEPLRRVGGITQPNWRRIWDAVRLAAGYGADGSIWPYDVMRHTFASYWLPVHQDRAHLSEIMGNSPAVIRRHYRRAIPLDEARAFWSLLP
jgi:integrase/recombinase XerD